jgi:hypothetical protein
MRSFIAFTIACCGWVALLDACFGGPTQEQLKTAAEGAYVAEHLRCVDKHDTNDEINACRAAVRMRWNIHVTETKLRDSGRDR